MCRFRTKGEVNRNEVQLLLGKYAQRFARRRDGRRHLVAASHGLRSHCGSRPALWAVFGHCGHSRGLDLRFVLAPDQRPHERNFARGFQRPRVLQSGRSARRLPGHVSVGDHDWLHPDSDRDIQTRGSNALHLGVCRDWFHGRGRFFGGINPTGQPDRLARSRDGAAACALPHLADAKRRPRESTGPWHWSRNHCSRHPAQTIGAQISSAAI